MCCADAQTAQHTCPGTAATSYHTGILIHTRGASSIVKLVTLGPEAIGYMREELAHPDPLADALRQMPLDAGRVIAYVPSQASAEEVHELRAVIRSSNVEGTQAFRATVEFVYRYLQQGGTRVLLMGSHPAMPSDWRVFNLPRFGRDWANRLTCEGQVYFFATEASDLNRVHDVFDDGQAMTIFGILASDFSWTPTRHSELARANLEDIVRHSDYVLVGSYDSTGMLIWSKQK